MTVRYTHIGTNDDGTPRFHIWSDDPDRQHLVMTGPIVGTVDAAGETVDVSAPWVALPTPDAALEVAEAISHRYLVEGHPDFIVDPDRDSYGFVHITADGVPHINAKAAPETVAEVEAMIEAHPELETGSLVKVEA